MAFKVIIDGKPCSGKTTLSCEVEKKLNSEGVSAIDAKSYALESGFMSGFLGKFMEGEIESYRSLVHSATYHVLSYVALEESAWKNNSKYEVVILQRSPYSFSFMIEATKSAFGKEPSHKQPNPLYGLIKTWAEFVRPELLIYLTTDVETLRERFKHRPDGRDRIHAQMIEADDSKYVEMLRGYMHNNLRVIENDSSVEEGAEKIAAAIKEAYSSVKLRRSLPFGAKHEGSQ